jgi:hypothetical protein
MLAVILVKSEKMEKVRKKDFKPFVGSLQE